MKINKIPQRRESDFYKKVIRNSLILGATAFFSAWATIDTFSWIFLKPIIVFTAMYFLSELAVHYRLKPATEVKTLVF